MERILQPVVGKKRARRHPRRVVLLWGVCVFAAVALGVMAVRSPVTTSLLPASGTVLDVPFIDQRDKYPTGCESVSAVMALQYAGVDVTVEEFIDQYLPQGEAPYMDESGALVGANPWKEFLGSPYSQDGWGCYAPVIGEAMKKLLLDRGRTDLRVEELYGVELSQLWEEYGSQGIPVLVWATIDMEQPQESTQYYLEDTGELFTWKYPLHCLVLTGERAGRYLFNDPMVGKNTAYPKDEVEAAYQGIGMQAVVLVGT